MSLETQEWLDTQVLVGCTDTRGNAWHWRRGNDNHYPAGIPVEDVRRRLFNFTVDAHPVAFIVPCDISDPRMSGLDDDGSPFRLVKSAQGRVGQLRSDTDFDLGVFGDGYRGHAYGEWLIENVQSMLGEGLVIGSAGLLRNGAVAWVQVEMPENMMTPSGERFRPFLMAFTSFDGSLATGYKLLFQRIVCDNTMTIGLQEYAPTWRTRHTAHSQFRSEDARATLGVRALEKAAAAFTVRAEEMINTPVTDEQWGALIFEIFGQRDTNGKLIPESQWSPVVQTRFSNKRAAVQGLWVDDERVAPFKGTAWGVLQAFSTHDLHIGTVRGKPRQERNMLAAVNNGLIDDRVLKAMSAQRVYSLA